MKRIIIVILFSLLLINITYASYCCQDPDTYQDKCYSDDDGECCGGIWYSSCYDFEIEVSGTNIFTIGQKTPVTIYIENTGAYSDTLTISALSSNPSIILVDMTGADIVTVHPGQTKKVYPRITVLAPNPGSVTFTADSPQAGSKFAVLTILESDSYYSLPEFSNWWFASLILLVGIIYFISRQRYFR